MGTGPAVGTKVGLLNCFARGSRRPVGRMSGFQRDEVGKTSAGPESCLTGVWVYSGFGMYSVWNQEKAKSSSLSLYLSHGPSFSEALLLVKEGLAWTWVPLRCHSPPPGWKTWQQAFPLSERPGIAGAFRVALRVMWAWTLFIWVSARRVWSVLSKHFLNQCLFPLNRHLCHFHYLECSSPFL